MKKYISFLPFVFVIVFVVIVSSVFLPQIKVEITIQPQSQSIVKAEKTENSVKEKAHCIFLYQRTDDVDKIIDKIQQYYDRGYRLRGFSGVPTIITAGVPQVAYYAPVCKE
ncbi:MAG: hypothetical protein QNJ49_09985 [Mastigocoleus sp. MO_167.B18]|nr:hypothetical protein [Mastigocoleus sp. MO_167.B18]